MQKMAKKAGIRKGTIRNIDKKDIGLKSWAMQPVQTLTTAQRLKRLKRSKALTNRLKCKLSSKVVIFSYEKNFYIDTVTNYRNTRYIPKTSEDVNPAMRYTNRSKHVAKAMMFGAITSDGQKMLLIWVDGNLGTNSYLTIVEKVLKWADTKYGCGNYVIQQDGAPFHTARATQEYLNFELGSNRFWSKMLWPPLPPNLNLLDFSIWTHMVTKGCAKFKMSVTTLKCTVAKEWTVMSADYIVSTCTTFQPWLKACISTEGGFSKNKFRNICMNIL